MANTKSAEKAARQSTVHRARNDALTSQLRSAIRKATLALKAGKHAEAASALDEATPVIDSMVNKGIIHRNKAAPLAAFDRLVVGQGIKPLTDRVPRLV